MLSGARSSVRPISFSMSLKTITKWAIAAMLFLTLLSLAAFSQAKVRNGPRQVGASKVKQTTGHSAVTQIDDARLKTLLRANNKPLLVNFWATWCDPCREEFPDLVKIDADYKGKIDFITV